MYCWVLRSWVSLHSRGLKYKSFEGACQREDLQILWELKNNANKKPQIKLQPGAIQSLQLFLQNLWERELLGKMTQHSYALCLRKGCSCRHAEQLPACLRKTSFNPSHLTSLNCYFVQEKLCYFRNTNDGHSALVIFHEGIELVFQLRLLHPIKLYAHSLWHSD